MARRLLIATTLTAVMTLAPVWAREQTKVDGTAALHVAVMLGPGMAGQSPNGSFAVNLTKADFTITDNGVRVPVLTCEPPAETSIVLLFDVSSSVRGTVNVSEATRRVLSVLRPQDELALGQFGATIAVDSTFTRDASALDKTAQTILDARKKSSGPSPLWDALTAAAGVLRSRPGRRVVIAVTDGEATGNIIPFRSAVQNLLAAGVEVQFVVRDIPARISPPQTNDLLPPPWEHPRQLSAAAGGSIFRSTADLDDGTEPIASAARAIEDGYRLTFTPTSWTAQPHTMVIKAVRPGLVVIGPTQYVPRQ